MAGEILNLYDLFVNNVFGSSWFAYFGLLFIYSVIGMIGEMSPSTLIMLLALYTLAFLIQIMGGLSALLIFIIAFIYLSWQIRAFVGRE